MSKSRNYHKKPVVAKDRFVGVRLDKESFLKVLQPCWKLVRS